MAFYGGLAAPVTHDRTVAVRLAPGCAAGGRLGACFEA